MTPQPKRVGVLYPGEMGASLAALLRGRDTRVLTTLAGRSDATLARTIAAGVIVVDSLAELVRQSDVVISLVLPAAAREVADSYCRIAQAAPAGAIYVDANSIGPDQIAAIATQVEASGRAFVDASINGLASRLASAGTLYLSGSRADEVAALFDGALQVRVLGTEPGRASAMKMLLGGVSKGMCALFTELALLAERQGMLDEMLEATSRTYPGLASLAERMMPTYPRHAARRVTEINELEATARTTGITPRVIAGVRQLHESMSRVWPTANNNEAGSADLASLIRHLADRMKEAEVV